MTINETKQFMERIKTYYPTFIIDDFTIKEWHSQLKDYTDQDINEKLNEHLKSEQFGDYIPKLNFLTKYLTKEKDKGIIKTYKISCSKCGKVLTNENIEEHYERCNSVQFLIDNSKKYLNKNLNRDKLMECDDKTFKDYYYKTCETILPLIQDNYMKKKCFENILNRHYKGENKYTMEELLS